jgi:thymidylate kinase
MGRDNIMIQVDSIPGSGKTYLLNRIAEHFALEYTIIYWEEPIELWKYTNNQQIDSIFDAFLKQPTKNSFIFQTLVFSTFLTEEAKFMKKCTELKNIDKPILIIKERGIDSALNIFLPTLQHVNWIEMKLLKEYGQAIEERLRKPDIRVYLDTSIELSMQRMINRNRENENYSLEYMTTLQKNYLELIKQWDSNTVVTLPDNDNLTPLIQKLEEIRTSY